jgi:amino acid transporter
MSGWLATMSWQAGTAGGAFLLGTITQNLIVLNNSSYIPQGWQGTLFVIVASLIVFIINIWGARTLSFLQNILFVLHVFGFIAVLVILWVVARVQPAKAVFTQFENNGGWSSMGLSLMVGQINAVYMAICAFARHLFVFSN